MLERIIGVFLLHTPGRRTSHGIVIMSADIPETLTRVTAASSPPLPQVAAPAPDFAKQRLRLVSLKTDDATMEGTEKGQSARAG